MASVVNSSGRSLTADIDKSIYGLNKNQESIPQYIKSVTKNILNIRELNTEPRQKYLCMKVWDKLYEDGKLDKNVYDKRVVLSEKEVRKLRSEQDRLSCLEKVIKIMYKCHDCLEDAKVVLKSLKEIKSREQANGLLKKKEEIINESEELSSTNLIDSKAVSMANKTAEEIKFAFMGIEAAMLQISDK